LWLLPIIASAHALPVGSEPASSQVLPDAPAAVSITFSEHIDEAASAIKVTGPDGAVVSEGKARVDTADTRILSIPIAASQDGAYLVSWSVVSSDDGHFTKGAYPFAVGTAGIPAGATAQQVEIVELSTAPEALTSGVELVGHGFLWAALVLFALAVRPLLRGGSFEKERGTIARLFAWVVSVGGVFAFFGGAAQVLIKSSQLASLQSLAFADALRIYAGTDAGAATVYRMAAAALFVLVFALFRKKIRDAAKLTAYELVMLAALCLFAYMRAKISHATSNPFHPDFSILVNFFHVIEKDIWAGILALVLLAALDSRLRRFLAALLPRAFAMLAVDFGAVGVTASYIIWLHLKSFGNLFTTQWGGVFLELLLLAVALVAFRAFHVLARLYRPALFSRYLAATLAAELGFAVLVIYCSSMVIITSPPLPQPHTAVFSQASEGMTVTLERSAHEDGMLLLTDSGGEAAMPTLTIGGASIELAKRFDGGYVFPATFLPESVSAIHVTVPQQTGYDAQVEFTARASDFEAKEGWEAHRPFDLFTIVLFLIALAIVPVAIALYRLSALPRELEPVSRRGPAVLAAGVLLFCTLFAGGSIIVGLRASGLENPFAYECRQDGNEWHIMLPTMAGTPTSQTPSEGCMWGMGAYMYMFADKREYDAYKKFPDADVVLASTPQEPVAGEPAMLTVSLKEPDGSPAALFVDMEKLLHVVIVSRDQSVYAHIHADDDRPLTQEEKDTSTFHLRYTFPKSGDYLVMADYAHGTKLESRQFLVHVRGGNPQADSPVQYAFEGDYDGYHVSVSYFQPFSGQVETFLYVITKDGKPVTLVPYLSAAMHVAAVKNDLSWHYHEHGEVHLPGTPPPPIVVRDGRIVHSMAAMYVPDTFALPVEAHLIFPSAGLYTVWGQFKTESGDIVAVPFTVRVER
jgi:methionine-rich copper-binding protein CopC